jgi:hypothetical protein
MEEEVAESNNNLHHAQAAAVLYHPGTLPQGDGDAGPTLAGGEERGERDLVVLDPGDVLDMLSRSGVQVSMRNVKWVLNVVVISALR